MPVFNTCSGCGAKVKTRRPRHPVFAKWLEQTGLAVCNVCNPNSSWRRVG